MFWAVKDFYGCKSNLRFKLLILAREEATTKKRAKHEDTKIRKHERRE
jgi:hypothetical protein